MYHSTSMVDRTECSLHGSVLFLCLFTRFTDINLTRHLSSQYERVPGTLNKRNIVFSCARSQAFMCTVIHQTGSSMWSVYAPETREHLNVSDALWYFPNKFVWVNWDSYLNAVCLFFRGTRVCTSDEMSSLEDILSSNQCPTAVITSQGTDVTPNRDSGVCKVIQSL